MTATKLATSVSLNNIDVPVDAFERIARLTTEADILEAVAETAAMIVGEWCVVVSFGDEGHAPAAAARARDSRTAEALAGFKPSESLIRESLASRVAENRAAWTGTAAAQEVLNMLADEEQHDRIARLLKPKTCLAVPFVLRSHVLCVAACFAANRDHYTKQEQNYLQELGERVVLPLENARLREALETADKRKDEFLAVLAHELRNPLATILSGINLLRRPITDERSAWVKGSLERQTKQLAKLIDDLLDVSRITQGKIQLREETVSLEEIAKTSVEEVRDLIEKRKHAFQVSLPKRAVWLHGDPARLEQILVNLLTNAAKYTDPGGRVSLTATCQHDEVILKVKDNGIGIPTEMQGKVFEMFGQLDKALNRAHGGLGIGLTLVQKLAELHHGSVSVTSSGQGGGSEFVVRLPAAPPPMTGQLQEDEAQPHTYPGPFRVLVVEDNRDAALMLASLLSESGHEVRVAHDGFRALESVGSWRPEVVLLDIGLPGLDGYEVASRLRREKQLPDSLIVAISGYGQQQDRQRSAQAGFDYHLLKPVDYQSLQDLLSNWSGR